MPNSVNTPRSRIFPVFVFSFVFTIVFLGTLVVATVITFFLPESFASTARISVEPENPPIPLVEQNTLAILRSPVILTSVINRLNLNAEWGKKYYAGETLMTSETMDILKRRMLLKAGGGANIISITCYGDDKNEAATLANTIGQSYIDYRDQAVVNTNPAASTQAIRVAQFTDRAEPGSAPAKPNKPLNIALGAIVGVILGAGGGALAAQFARRG